MLHRSTSAPVWSPARRLAERLAALTGLSSGLLRFVLLAAMLTAIGCLYLWQVNDLSTLHDNTEALKEKAQVLEQKNVVLAQQLAQWNSPSYVDQLSTQQGYVVAAKRTIAAPLGVSVSDQAPVEVAPAAAALAIEPNTTR